MTLSEKFLYCRKKCGLSQDALADIIGVSRQSVSKWETGESVPEVGKLPLLAKTFGVTSDWLLSDEEPKEPEIGFTEAPEKSSDNWVDSIPGVIGKLIRQYGWLYGVYTALAGGGFVLIGVLARILTRTTIDSFGSFGPDYPFGSGGEVWYDEAGNIISSPFGESVSVYAENPVSIMGTFIIVIGVVLIVAGVFLAIYLKNRKDK